MTVARLLRVSGCHAERLHDPQVHDLTPRAVEFDEQWSYVKKSGRVRHRSPAMAAGLTDHVWTIREWLLKPAFGR